MNGKRAKAHRKHAGFVPSGERQYEWFAGQGWQTDRSHVERKGTRLDMKISPAGEPAPVEFVYSIPLTARNIRLTPRAIYQEGKRA